MTHNSPTDSRWTYLKIFHFYTLEIFSSGGRRLERLAGCVVLLLVMILTAFDTCLQEDILPLTNEASVINTEAGVPVRAVERVACFCLRIHDRRQETPHISSLSYFFWLPCMSL